LVIDQLRKRVSNIAMLIPRRILRALFFSFCFIVLAVNGGICEEDLSKGIERKFLGFTINVSDKTYLVVKDANVRAGPKTKYRRVGKLQKGVRINTVGNVKGTKWIAIERNNKDFGFVYIKVLSRVLEGKLMSPVNGTIMKDGRPRCIYTLSFIKKTVFPGFSQIISDYTVVFACKIISKKIKFVANMFLTELPYKQKDRNIFQITVDLPNVTDKNGEIISGTSFFDVGRNLLTFEAAFNSKNSGDRVKYRSKARSIPEALKSAIEWKILTLLNQNH